VYFCYKVAFSIDDKNLEIFSFALMNEKKIRKVLSKAVVLQLAKKRKLNYCLAL